MARYGIFKNLIAGLIACIYRPFGKAYTGDEHIKTRDGIPSKENVRTTRCRSILSDFMGFIPGFAVEGKMNDTFLSFRSFLQRNTVISQKK